MSWIITWIAIGAIMTLGVDWIALWVGNPANMLTNKERVIVILGWPVYLVVFVYSFVKALLNDE